MSSRKSANGSRYRSGTRSRSTIRNKVKEMLEKKLQHKKQVEHLLDSRICKADFKDVNNYPTLVKILEERMNHLEPLTMQNFRPVLLNMCNLTSVDNIKQKEVLKNVLRIVKVQEKAYHSVLNVNPDYFDPEVINEYKQKIKNMETISHYITIFLNSTENPILKKGGKWSLKYKRSIDCNNPKGFSQKQHCKYGRKTKKIR